MLNLLKSKLKVCTFSKNTLIVLFKSNLGDVQGQNYPPKKAITQTYPLCRRSRTYICANTHQILLMKTLNLAHLNQVACDKETERRKTCRGLQQRKLKSVCLLVFERKKLRYCAYLNRLTQTLTHIHCLARTTRPDSFSSLLSCIKLKYIRKHLSKASLDNYVTRIHQCFA